MSLLNSLVGAATSGIDMFMGGQLSKATLEVDRSDSRAGEMAGEVLTFQFNPETIKIQRFAPTTQTPTHGTENVASRQQTAPSKDRESTIQLNNLVFDTYENKPFDSVYKKYIEVLERFAGYDKHKHAPARLLFNWGSFTGERMAHLGLICWIERLDSEYTMFLNNGTPVRAKVNLTLKTGLPPDQQADQHGLQSPDHAKLYTLKRGDTLADIAFAEYDNPGEWRRIANLNGIDDPMAIRPGMKLLVPPIL